MEWKALARSEALPKYRSNRDELKALFFRNTGLPEWAKKLLSLKQDDIEIRQGVEKKMVKLIDHGITYKNEQGSSIQAAIATKGEDVFIVVNNDGYIDAQRLTGAASNDSLFAGIFAPEAPYYDPPRTWLFHRAYREKPVRPTVYDYSWSLLEGSDLGGGG